MIQIIETVNPLTKNYQYAAYSTHLRLISSFSPSITEGIKQLREGKGKELSTLSEQTLGLPFKMAFQLFNKEL